MVEVERIMSKESDDAALPDPQFEKLLNQDVARSAGSPDPARDDLLAKLASPARRRMRSRFSSDIQSVTITSDKRSYRPQKVLDESSGGMGLLIDDVQDLRPGDHIEVSYLDSTMTAVVRAIVPTGSRSYRLGIEWLEPPLYP